MGVAENLTSSAKSSKTISVPAGKIVVGSSLNESFNAARDATVSGGKGDDIYTLMAPAKLIELPGEGIDTVISHLTDYQLPDNIENLQLAGTAWSVGIGNSLGNILTGNSGNNVLDGRGGDDLLTGGGGADTFIVGQGNDVITDFAKGQDRIDLTGVAGLRWSDLYAGALEQGGDLLIALPGGSAVKLLGTRFADLSPLVVSLAAGGRSSASATTQLSAATLSSRVDGTAAADKLSAKGNDNVLAGGQGDDTYLAYSSANKIIEASGAGVDTVQTWGDGFKLPDNVENLYLEGTRNSFGTGNALANIIRGNSGDNTLTGGGGEDYLLGGGGADTFVIRASTDTLFIGDFKASEGDKLKIEVPGVKSAAGILQDAVEGALGTELRLAGTRVVLVGVKVADIPASSIQAPEVAAVGRLTFSDDFNTGLSLSDRASGTWQTTYAWENASLRHYKGELQRYVDPMMTGADGKSLGLDPFTVADGVLSISADRVAPEIAAVIGSNYSSGLITTQSSFAQTYGIFEMRAKLPAGDGLWPAFWLLSVYNVWPPELDVFEVVTKRPDEVNMSIGSADKTWGNNGARTDKSTVAGLTEKLNTYQVEWRSDYVIWRINGIELTRMQTPPDMHQPMYMLANLAVGGGWAGAPSEVATHLGDMKIDYIRAYSLVDPSPVASAASTKTVTVFTNAVVGTDANETFNVKVTGKISGGQGDDIYVIDYAAGDKVNVVEKAGGGIDTIKSWYNHVLPANVEHLFLLGNSWISGTGNALPNRIVGNSGNNILDGGGGDDWLTGGAGADRFFIRLREGSDTITDLQSGDKVVLTGTGMTNFSQVLANAKATSTGTDILLDNWQTLHLAGVPMASLNPSMFTFDGSLPVSSKPTNHFQTSAPGERLIGSAGADELISKHANSVLLGGTGDDTYTLLPGDKVFEAAQSGIDTILSYHSVTMMPNVENLRLLGGSWVNAYGNELSNIIEGNLGNNRIDGGAGDDYLTGRGGKDVFVIHKGQGHDTITDFQIGGKEADHLSLVGFSPGAKIVFTGGSDWAVIEPSGAQEIITLLGIKSLLAGTFDFS